MTISCAYQLMDVACGRVLVPYVKQCSAFNPKDRLAFMYKIVNGKLLHALLNKICRNILLITIFSSKTDHMRALIYKSKVDFMTKREEGLVVHEFIPSITTTTANVMYLRRKLTRFMKISDDFLRKCRITFQVTQSIESLGGSSTGIKSCLKLTNIPDFLDQDPKLFIKIILDVRRTRNRTLIQNLLVELTTSIFLLRLSCATCKMNT